MKIKLIFIYIVFTIVANGQTPSSFLRMATTATQFGQNVPQGTILVDMQSLKRYMVLAPLTSTKSISNSNKLLLDGIHVDPDGTTAEIREIGTNSSTHYLGEIVTTDAVGTDDDGIVIAIWTKDGIEQVLLTALADATPGVWSTSAPGLWHLPSITELTTCFNTAIIVNTVLPTNGFKADYYWSSTELLPLPATKAYAKGFVRGDVPAPYSKANTWNIRYVRIHQ